MGRSGAGRGTLAGSVRYSRQSLAEGGRFIARFTTDLEEGLGSRPASASVAGPPRLRRKTALKQPPGHLSWGSGITHVQRAHCHQCRRWCSTSPWNEWYTDTAYPAGARTGFEPRTIYEPRTGFEPRTIYEPRIGYEPRTAQRAGGGLRTGAAAGGAGAGRVCVRDDLFCLRSSHTGHLTQVIAHSREGQAPCGGRYMSETSPALISRILPGPAPPPAETCPFCTDGGT